MSFWRDALIAFSLLITAYFVLWNVSQIAMSPLAAVTLWRHRQPAHPARPRPGQRRRGAAARLDRRARLQRGADDCREHPRAARARLRAARGRDRQRRVHGWHAGAPATDLSARARTTGVRSAAALRAGARHLPVGQRARSRGRRQGERRIQGGRGQRRHQRRVRRPGADHRCRHRARGRRAEPRRAAVPRRPGDGGGRGRMSGSPTAVGSRTAASSTSRCRAAGSRASRSSSTCARSSCSGSHAPRRMPS